MSDPVLNVEYLGDFFCCRALSSSLILISAALRALCVAMGIMPTPAPVLVRGLMLKCLIPPPNPNFDLSRSGVAAAGSKCTTLPGVISPRLSETGAGIGA
eukprot:420884-Rhodomonas_salina.1